MAQLLRSAGTGAATLMGLMFIALSLAVGAKGDRNSRKDIDAWITPSLVYFIEVFIVAAAAVAPLGSRLFSYVLLGLLSINLPFGL